MIHPVVFISLTLSDAIRRISTGANDEVAKVNQFQAWKLAESFVKFFFWVSNVDSCFLWYLPLDSDFTPTQVVHLLIEAAIAYNFVL